MKNKMSFSFLIVFMIFLSACKTEAKPSTSVAETTSSEALAVETNPSSEITKNTEVEAAKEALKTVDSATASANTTNETPKPKAEKQAPIKEAKPAKEVVAKTTEVVKGTIESKPKAEVKPPIKVKPTVPQVEDKFPKVEDTPKEVKTEKPSKPEVIEKSIGFPNHGKFDALLKANVSASGVVNYAGLKSKESTLDEYLTYLQNHTPGTTWNRNQELAFWINAYNAYTIKLILKNYPVKSITDLDGGKPWDVKWIELDGKTLSLNNIENDIIRPKYNEPRIHFAVNCAAKSCPPILNGAFKAKSLDAQLESQTKKFINNAAFNTLGKNEIKVSKIFEWYGVDFGDVASFVLRYSDSTVKPSANVSFMEYDWSLNGTN